MKKRVFKIAFRVVLVYLALAAILPRFPIAQLREPIRKALESSLGRRVELGDVRLGLLPQPGFTVNNVTIGEDPAVGSEAAVYVNTMRAVPGLATIFGGRMEFASVNLTDASVNLTRADRANGEVRWNFSSLLRPELLATFPSVHLRGGRINFKFNDTKSIFYLLETDVDLWPPGSADGAWTLRVKGEPARTDRAARGFGSFIARGQWQPRNSTATIDVKMEQSQLGDMITLFRGQESGIEGTLSGDAHLAGPLNRLGLAGRLTVANVHGWDQKPPGGNVWPLDISGEMDAAGQSIDFYAKLPGAQSPLNARYRVAEYLKRPRWGVTVNVSQFPLDPLAGVLRNVGLGLPPEFKLTGMVEGAFGWSLPEGTPRMDGGLHIANAVLAASGAVPLRVADASVIFSGSTVRLTPARITNDQNEAVTLEASWDAGTGATEATLASDGMAIAPLHRHIVAARIPLLSFATAGRWKGKLSSTGNLSTDEPNSWRGDIHFEDTDIPFEAFAEPLHVTSADAVVNGGDLVIRKVNVSAGGMQVQGDYHYQPGAEHPHQFRLTAPKLDAAALEKLLMPALRRGNFLTYAFNFGRVPQPDWLREMKADGTIQAAVLDMGGNEFTRVRSRVVWDGTSVELSGLELQQRAATFSGAASIQLANREPAYHVAAKMAGVPWLSGSVGGEGSLATSGTGAALLTNLKATGTFQGRRVELTPPGVWDSVAGAFDWAWEGRTPRVHLTDLVMKGGGRTYEGSAESQNDGQVVLRVSDGGKKIQAAGALLQGEALKTVAQ